MNLNLEQMGKNERVLRQFKIAGIMADKLKSPH